METVNNILKEFKIPLKTPWKQIPHKIQKIILYGDKNNDVKCLNKFEGIVNFY